MQAPQTDTSIFSNKIDSVDIKTLTYFYVFQGCPPCNREHPEKQYGFKIKCVGCNMTQEIKDHNLKIIQTLDKKYGQGWTEKYLKSYCESTDRKLIDEWQKK
jgi:hypothetical protein